MKRILIILSLIALSAGSLSADDYHFVYIEEQPLQKICSLLLDKIYERIGVDAIFSSMSGIRAEKEAAAGTVAGEVGRIIMYGEIHPNLIMVPTPYYKVETMAFARRDSGITDISTTELAKYKVTKIRGIKNTDNLTRGIDNVLEFDSIGKMMDFLMLNRAEIGITGRINGLLVLKKLEISEIVAIEPPLITNYLYHYIHKDHAELVPRIDTAIREMISNGELAEITHEIENSMFNGSDF